jgi:V8-like Glu-specific endopeptidase
MAKSSRPGSQHGKTEKTLSANRPLTPDELLAFENTRAAEPVPEMTARQLATSRLIVSHLRQPIEPEPLTGEAGVYQWPLPEGAVVGLPGRNITNIRAKSVNLAKAGAKAELGPHRPKWADQVYHPKRSISPPWLNGPVRRRGGSAELYYGVYPPEDRAVYYPEGYPWQCIGRVFVWNDASATNWAWSGSAVLAGPRVVLTAGHVVPWDAKTWMIRFIPAYYDGKSIAGDGAASWVSDAQGWDVSYKSRLPNAFDMAVLRLYDPIGESLGYFGAKTYTTDLTAIKYFNLTGYPSLIAGAERPSYQPGIEVLDTDPNGDALYIEHHGDSTGGDSGAPFWATWTDGFPYAIGTVSGGAYEYEPKDKAYEDNNIVAGGKAMVDLIQWGRTNWP